MKLNPGCYMLKKKLENIHTLLLIKYINLMEDK